jgi:uncharacterized ferritin-like protein (DUF455 family)
MIQIDPADTITVRGATLRRDPAREPCFKVVYLHRDLHLATDLSDESRRERLHRNVNNEIQSLEIAAQSLADFPEAPWELRLELARQCWDETRHAAMYYRELLARGGYKGEFPVANHEWGVVCAQESLEGRLAIQNRSFEAGTLDSMRSELAVFETIRDRHTVELIDALMADEVHHVRFANQWIKRMAQRDLRVLLRVAAAMSALKHVNSALKPRLGEMSVNGKKLGHAGGTIIFQVSAGDRGDSGFSHAEVGEVVRQDHRDRPESDLTATEQLQRFIELVRHGHDDQTSANGAVS